MESLFVFIDILMFSKKLELNMVYCMHCPYSRFFLICSFSLANNLLSTKALFHKLGGEGNLNSFLIISYHQ